MAFEGRFDHAVILVDDLARASETYARLGFAVSPGGSHTGRGTHNAIIRFGLDYLELLAVRDEAEAERAPTGAPIVERLRAGRGGLASFALATSDIAGDAERFARTGLNAVGPFPMQRRRPDGKLLSWRLLVPEGTQWSRPWPFFIQWDQDDATRLRWDSSGRHQNGATAVRGVSVAVSDLDAATALYERRLGLARGADGAVAALGARTRTFRAGANEVSLHAADGAGVVARRLAELGEGVFELTLAVSDLAATRELLERAGVTPERRGTDFVLPGRDALGAQLVFVERRH